MASKKAFTLIELMIVLGIIGLLIPVVVPHIDSIRTSAKDRSVEANIIMVKAYLQDRRYADKNTICTEYEKGGTPLNQVLYTVEEDVGQGILKSLTGSRALDNPFTGNKGVIYDKPVLSDVLSDCSVIVNYDSGILPQNETAITYPVIADWKVYTGKVIVTVYKDGYVGYGIGHEGEKLTPFVVKMPDSSALDIGVITPTPSPTPTNTPTPSPKDELVKQNYDTVIDYLRQRVDADLQDCGKDKEKNLMNYLYNFPSSGLKSLSDQFGQEGTPLTNPYSTGTSTCFVHSNGFKEDNSYSIIVFNMDQSEKHVDTAKLAGTILIFPYDAKYGSEAHGYEVWGVMGDGTCEKTDVYPQ